MAGDKETRAGLISGLIAVVLVIMLSAMALSVMSPGAQIADQGSAMGSPSDALRLSPTMVVNN